MSNADFRRSYANETMPGVSKEPWRERGGKLEEGWLRRQTRATGLSESTQKTITLLKSTFKLEAISEIYYLSAMEGKMFDVPLIPEFNGAATNMPIVEWSGSKMWNLCVSFALQRLLSASCH